MSTLVTKFNYNHTSPIQGYMPERNILSDYNPFMSFTEWIESKGFPSMILLAGTR